MSQTYTIQACFDPEADVWYVESSNVPGLATEAPTVEALLAKLPGMIADLLEPDDIDGAFCEVPVEVCAHTIAKVRLGVDA